MGDRRWTMTVGKGLVLVAALLVALNVRDLAAMAGIRIPGLPLPAYAGSSMDNLLSVLLVLVVLLALRPRKPHRPMTRLLGLGVNGWKAPLLVLLATLPFWIGCAFLGKPQNAIDWRDILFTALLFPLAEELVFRGFGFVFPRKALGWRMAPAVLIQAAVFGWVHWLGMRESDLAVQVFIITFLGGIVFAALDAMDGYALWCGWVFHVSLNAAWDVFDVAPSAATGWQGNGLRLLCAALAMGAVWSVRRPTSSLARDAAPIRAMR
ncbi:CPBP family intramembrane glutamic endopeptidase [Dyella telluris]|uniref:CPBP family intramembrane metalloprotease n=1 Tax=Dyella telluris TaxID=2763498 RepID=A0A7G8Q445_9GAMM|nr:CPBP family intramembrane glutamic endopeptidase [Dyella telluris]QNK01553.1 CPBP family intramembrane metalloprotease [Dyella telluris]